MLYIENAGFCLLIFLRFSLTSLVLKITDCLFARMKKKLIKLVFYYLLLYKVNKKMLNVRIDFKRLTF